MSSRYLSSLEEFFFYRSKWNLHSCFYTGITLNKLPTKEQIQHSLKQTIERFPPLHSNVTEQQDGKLLLKSFQLSNITFDQVVEYKEDWTQMDSSTINSIFKNYNFEYLKEVPLWKLLVVPQLNMILLVVDHVLTDGMGSVKFWKSFINNLGPSSLEEILYQPIASTSDDEVIKHHPYDYWPIPWSWKLKRKLIPFLVKWKPDLVTGLDATLLQFNKYSFPDDLLDMDLTKPLDYVIKNDNIHWCLNVPTADLKKVLNECKQHQVSLTSYIAATFAVALNNNIDDDKATNKGSKIKVDIPMNTRAVCKAVLGSQVDDSDLEIGNFVAGLEYEMERSEINDIWEVAKEIQSSISESSKDKINDTINQAKLLDIVDTKDYVLPKVKNTGPGSTFEVTNLGFQKFKGDDDEDNSEFQIQDAVFNEPQGISDIFTCSVFSTTKGGMNISISAPKNVNDQLSEVWSQVMTFF